VLSRELIVGAGVGAALGLVVATAVGVIHAVVPGIDAALRNGAGPLRLRPPDPFPVRAASFALALVIAISNFACLLKVSEQVMLFSLRRTILMLGATACVALALVIADRSRPPLSRLLSRWDHGGRAEASPSSAAFRMACWGTFPTLALSLPLLIVYDRQLGSLRPILIVVSFVAVECLLVFAVRAAPVARMVRILGSAAQFALIISGLFLLRPIGSQPQIALRGRFLPEALATLQNLTDVDRDGFSSIFGGRDCAPFNASRFPGAPEILRNGVDENCDGTDALVATLAGVVEPTFSLRAPPDRALNVLWYIVDSLRADHLQTYGYAHETSPTLSALGNEALVFEDAHSQSSTTALSLPSMFSGRNPTQLRWSAGSFPVVSSEEFFLSRAFTEKGYLTALILNDWVKGYLPGIQHGFEHILVAPPEVRWRSGDYVLSNLFEVIHRARTANKPFFAVAHIDDVHHPYISAEGKAVAEYRSAGDRAKYAAGIAVFDQNLRVAVNHLKHTGLWDKTVLIVTADHGEEFGEHGGNVHSRTCYAEVTHVPLVLRIPNAPPGRIRSPVALVDLAPTLLELIGARTESVTLDGQSLLIPAYEPTRVAATRPRFCTIFHVSAARESFFTRGVRQGKWSLFEEARTGNVELYDTSRDPRERFDLAKSPRDMSVVPALRQLLYEAAEGNLFRVSQGLE
jgi:arylsulfatase A-like enzyme